MNIEELNEWTKTEEGNNWLNSQKSGLLAKNKELLGKITTATQNYQELQNLSNAQAEKLESLENRLSDIFVKQSLMTRRFVPNTESAIKNIIFSQSENGFKVVANGDTVEFVDDSGKSFNDYFNEWVVTEDAKYYLANGNSGGLDGGRPLSELHKDYEVNRYSLQNMSVSELANRLKNQQFAETVNTIIKRS